MTLAGKKEERQVPCLEYWYELEVKDQRIPRGGARRGMGLMNGVAVNFWRLQLAGSISTHPP